MDVQHVTIDGITGTTPLSGEFGKPDGRGSAERESTIVIMIHDIPFSHSRDHHDLFGYVRNLIDEFGFYTLLFDFQSCGESEGREEMLTLETARENLQRVIDWAKSKGFTKLIFAGCGLGAALALEKTNKDTDMLFLFWPVVDLASHARKIFYAADGQRVAAQGRKISGDLVNRMETYNISSLMKSLKIPVLIQYGTHDDIVGPEHIDTIKRGFNALRIDITSYEGGNHGLTDPRHRTMMGLHIRSFLEKYA